LNLPAVSWDAVEWAQVHDRRYGSALSDTETLLAKGYNVLFDIDVQGGFQIKKTCPEALLVFLLPPSLDVLVSRLSKRGTEEKSEQRNRLKTAIREMEQGLWYDYHVINDNLEWAVLDVHQIVEGVYKKKRKRKTYLEELILRARTPFLTD